MYFYCIFYIMVYYMVQCHGVEPLCNIRSARDCVFVCVCVSVTSFGKSAGPRHSAATLKRYFLNSSC